MTARGCCCIFGVFFLLCLALGEGGGAVPAELPSFREKMNALTALSVHSTPWPSLRSHVRNTRACTGFFRAHSPPVGVSVVCGQVLRRTQGKVSQQEQHTCLFLAENISRVMFAPNLRWVHFGDCG